jgi:hypothetical protein
MTTPVEGATIDLVVFEAGDWRVGFEARRVRASRGVPAVGLDCPTAGLPTAESLLDMPASRQPAAANQILTINCPDGNHDILIAGTIELLSVATELIYPLPTLLAARNYLPGLRALIVQPKGKLVMLFDSNALRFAGAG